ncbi:MAG: tetratricopeptide repeat protein [Bacteroidota bacterium]
MLVLWTLWGMGWLFAQPHDVMRTNNSLRGKILFLSSGKQAAKGVKISGRINELEHANAVYTSSSQGEFELTFPTARDGFAVELQIGETDQEGNEIEVVNERAVEACQIPAQVTDEFTIIVAIKGSRDAVALRYYNIFNISIQDALQHAEQEWARLVADPDKDYQKIQELSAWIDKTKKQQDSVALYKEAYRIASINKDFASDRILKYLKLLDEGKQIQEALKVLQPHEAMQEGRAGINRFNAAIEELDIRASGLHTIFHYQEALSSYDSILSLMDEMDLNRMRFVEYYKKANNVLNDDGKYKGALVYQNKALDIQKKHLNAGDREIAASYANLGNTYRKLGKFKQALQLQKRSQDSLEKILDPKHLVLAASYNNICLTYLALGKRDSALIFTQKAVQIGKEKLDSLDLDLASYYSNMGLVYKENNQFQEAIVYYQKALSIRSKILSSNDPDLANAYNSLALAYQGLRNHRQAIVLFRKALSIRETTLHPKHPDLANSYNNIASTHQYLRENKETLFYLHKAIDILREILDPLHPDLATVYNNYALALQDKGDYQQALHYHQDAIAIRESVLDSLHPDLATSFHNIANTLQALNQFPEALSFRWKAIHMREQIFHKNHPKVAASYGGLGNTFEVSGEPDSAIKYKIKAVHIFESQPTPHPDLAMYYGNLGNAYESLEQYEKALEFQEKSVGMMQKRLPPTHPMLGMSYNNIANTHKKLTNFPLAIAYQRRCLENFETSLSPEHPYQQAAFQSLLSIYHARGMDLYEKGAYASALTDFDTILTHSRDSSQTLCDALFYAGKCQDQLGDYAQAIQHYLQAQLIFPDIIEGDFYADLGLAYLKNHQWSLAESAFHSYEQLYPLSGISYRNRAAFHSIQRQPKLAKKALKSAWQAGYQDLAWLQSDSSMDSIRNETFFIRLVNKLNKKSS